MLCVQRTQHSFIFTADQDSVEPHLGAMPPKKAEPESDVLHHISRTIRRSVCSAKEDGVEEPEDWKNVLDLASRQDRALSIMYFGERRRSIDEKQALSRLSKGQIARAKEKFNEFANDGVISREEFSKMMSDFTLFANLSEEQQTAMNERTFRYLDKDMSGNLTWQEVLWYFAACRFKFGKDVIPKEPVLDQRTFEMYMNNREKGGPPVPRDCYSPSMLGPRKTTEQQILFAHIGQYKPKYYHLPIVFKPFIPEYVAATGEQRILPGMQMLVPDDPVDPYKDLDYSRLPEHVKIGSGEVGVSPEVTLETTGPLLDAVAQELSIGRVPDINRSIMRARSALAVVLRDDPEGALMPKLTEEVRRISSVLYKIPPESQRGGLRLVADLAALNKEYALCITKHLDGKLWHPYKHVTDDGLRALQNLSNYSSCRSMLLDMGVVEVLVSTRRLPSSKEIRAMVKDIRTNLRLSQDDLDEAWKEMSTKMIQSSVRARHARNSTRALFAERDAMRNSMAAGSATRPVSAARTASTQATVPDVKNSEKMAAALRPLWMEIVAVKHDLLEVLRATGKRPPLSSVMGPSSRRPSTTRTSTTRSARRRVSTGQSRVQTARKRQDSERVHILDGDTPPISWERELKMVQRASARDWSAIVCDLFPDLPAGQRMPMEKVLEKRILEIRKDGLFDREKPKNNLPESVYKIDQCADAAPLGRYPRAPPKTARGKIETTRDTKPWDTNDKVISRGDMMKARAETPSSIITTTSEGVQSSTAVPSIPGTSRPPSSTPQLPEEEDAEGEPPPPPYKGCESCTVEPSRRSRPSTTHVEGKPRPPAFGKIMGIHTDRPSSRLSRASTPPFDPNDELVKLKKLDRMGKIYGKDGLKPTWRACAKTSRSRQAKPSTPDVNPEDVAEAVKHVQYMEKAFFHRISAPSFGTPDTDEGEGRISVATSVPSIATSKDTHIPSKNKRTVGTPKAYAMVGRPQRMHFRSRSHREAIERFHDKKRAMEVLLGAAPTLLEKRLHSRGVKAEEALPNPAKEKTVSARGDGIEYAQSKLKSMQPVDRANIYRRKGSMIRHIMGPSARRSTSAEKLATQDALDVLIGMDVASQLPYISREATLQSSTDEENREAGPPGPAKAAPVSEHPNTNETSDGESAPLNNDGLGDHQRSDAGEEDEEPPRSSAGDNHSGEASPDDEVDPVKEANSNDVSGEDDDGETVPLEVASGDPILVRKEDGEWIPAQVAKVEDGFVHVDHIRGKWDVEEALEFDIRSPDIRKVSEGTVIAVPNGDDVDYRKVTTVHRWSISVQDPETLTERVFMYEDDSVSFVLNPSAEQLAQVPEIVQVSPPPVESAPDPQAPPGTDALPKHLAKVAERERKMTRRGSTDTIKSENRGSSRVPGTNSFARKPDTARRVQGVGPPRPAGQKNNSSRSSAEAPKRRASISVTKPANPPAPKAPKGRTRSTATDSTEPSRGTRGGKPEEESRRSTLPSKKAEPVSPSHKMKSQRSFSVAVTTQESKDALNLLISAVDEANRNNDGMSAWNDSSNSQFADGDHPKTVAGGENASSEGTKAVETGSLKDMESEATSKEVDTEPPKPVDHSPARNDLKHGLFALDQLERVKESAEAARNVDDADGAQLAAEMAQDHANQCVKAMNKAVAVAKDAPDATREALEASAASAQAAATEALNLAKEAHISAVEKKVQTYVDEATASSLLADRAGRDALEAEDPGMHATAFKIAANAAESASIAAREAASLAGASGNPRVIALADIARAKSSQASLSAEKAATARDHVANSSHGSGRGSVVLNLSDLPEDIDVPISHEHDAGDVFTAAVLGATTQPPADFGFNSPTKSRRITEEPEECNANEGSTELTEEERQAAEKERVMAERRAKKRELELKKKALEEKRAKKEAVQAGQLSRAGSRIYTGNLRDPQTPAVKHGRSQKGDKENDGRQNVATTRDDKERERGSGGALSGGAPEGPGSTRGGKEGHQRRMTYTFKVREKLNR